MNDDNSNQSGSQEISGRAMPLTPGSQPKPEPVKSGPETTGTVEEVKVIPPANNTALDKMLTVDNDPASEALKIPVDPETGVRNGDPVGGLIPARKDEDGSQELSE